MRTRQLRLNDQDQIQRRMPEFLGKKINIVLADRTVMFGEVRKVDESNIILRNMRMENIRYPFKNIVEIYLDAIV
jgi:small nuclear ribonucleoprotein (snRNP)-like protein